MKRTLPAGLVAGTTLVFVGALLGAVPTSAAHADATTCHGKAATIVSGADHVVGTPGDDVIVVTGGLGKVDAGAGDDTICLQSLTYDVGAGPGDDVVDATGVAPSDDSGGHADLGPGSDTFLGTPGEDFVTAGSGGGHDVISTGDGGDFVTVTSGTADVSTGAGNDLVFVQPGHLEGGTLDLGSDDGLNHDKLFVETRRATVVADERRGTLRVDGAHYTLAGAEVVTASGRTVRVRGSQQADVVHTFGCQVSLRGRGGADRLFLDRGPTIGLYGVPVHCDSVRGHLQGGNGNDHLYAFSGHVNVLVGGAGLDDAFGGGRSTCYAEHTSGC